MQRFRIWVQRVPTEDNLADLPSRGEYELLDEIGAVYHKPCIANLYLEESSSAASAVDCLV